MERGSAYGKGAPTRRTREGDGWRQSTATRSDGKPPWAVDGASADVQDTAEHEELHEDRPAKTDYDLPEGWEALDDEEGNIYFHHVPTGATQWESPTKEGEHHEEATMPPVEEQEPAAASQRSQHEGMQEEGHVESKHEEPEVGPEAEVGPEQEEEATRSIRKNDSLPPDWEEIEDVEGGVYYHHVPTGHTQWEPPPRDASAKDTQAAVADSSAPQDARHQVAPSL